MNYMSPQMKSLIYGKATNYDSVIFLACNEISDLLEDLNSMGIIASAIDYDPKFENKKYYECKDFIFDEVKLDADLIVHLNCEKTFMFETDSYVLLVGYNKKHNGDCKSIESSEQLIEEYKLKEIYEKGNWSERATFLNGISHFWVHGRM